MHRILLIGSNSDFPRASARPASATEPTVLPASLALRGNCDAGFSSGRTPDAAAGGSRLHSAEPLPRRAPGFLIAQVVGLGARFWWDCIGMFVAGCVTVAVLTLVLL